MDYKEFHNLKGIAEKDREPGDAGVLIHKDQHIVEDINLGQTRAEINKTLANLLPGLDPETINEFTEEALQKQLEKGKLNNFAKLKLESLNASATENSKSTIQEKRPNDFIEKVDTPTINSPDSAGAGRSVATKEEDQAR